MVAAFTYYKKCICSEGTSTTYAPGCPVHDPRMKPAFGCSNCKRLESENKRLIDIAGEALGFSPYQRDQDTVEVLANHCKRLAEELATVKGERDEYKKRMIYWINAFLIDFLEWLKEDEARIEFLKHDIPDTLKKLREAMEV